MSAQSAFPREQSVAELFERHVARAPEALALSWGDETLSYEELNARANQLAHALRAEGVDHETPVAVFMEPSAELIIAILAICKAGGTYLPLDVSYPEARLSFMLADVDAALIVTDSSARLSLPEHEARVLCVDAAAKELDGLPRENLSSSARGDSRVYIMYTSGSTGTPKGIEILHRGISRLVLNTNYMEVDASDRVAQVANAAFDAFTWEMWTALLNGAALIGVPRETLLDPFALADFIATRGITSMLLTTALFHFVAREHPSAFETLRTLVVGGEALAPQWARRVLQGGAPGRLINAYGPTESTVAATCHIVREVEEGALSIPIGAPVSNTSVYVLNGDMRPVEVGEVGEIFIGGDGLARGYLGRPALSAERFVNSPFQAGAKLYRSGDLGRWRSDGALEFCGRVDAQVKIRGFRIELGGVESVIRRHPAVAEVAVLAREGADGNKQLVAYVVLARRELNAAGRRAEALQELVALRRALRQQLPEYMIPSSYALLDELPLTPNRKLDRKRLPSAELVLADTEAVYVAPATETARAIAGLWSELLGVERVSETANWTECGGNSLLAAQLLLRIQDRLGVKVPAYLFYEEPTVGQLACRVDEQREGVEISVADAAAVDLLSEARLDPAIRPSADASFRWRAPTRALVTGATGFLGAWIVRDLMNMTRAEVCCLVRADDDQAALERVRDNMRKYGVWDERFAARLTAVAGDLTRRELGLSRDVYARLAARVDTIYHSGAHVSYVEPYSWHKPANVDGTVEIIRFAFAGQIKALHHVSTISVFGPSGFFNKTTEVFEDTDIRESAALLHLDMGYSQSKWVAEALLEQARARGLPVNIYRPGFILGDSQTGTCNIDDFVARLISGCAELKRFPLLPDQRKEFVAVDFASAALVEISTHEDRIGQRFHLVPPEQERSVSMVDFFELIRECGYEMESCAYADWVDAVREVVAERASHVLLPLMPALSERIYEESLTRWELYRHMPRYRCENTRAALVGSGIEFPHMTHALIRRYLQFLSGQGLLDAPQRAAEERLGACPAVSAVDGCERDEGVFLVELSSGHRITVPPGFDAEELRRLVLTIEGAA